MRQVSWQAGCKFQMKIMKIKKTGSIEIKCVVYYFIFYLPQVIQRRDDFGEPKENFNRDWTDYKNGFGDPAREFWLGNENIYMLTNNDDYSLRVELEDFEGNKR